MQTPARQAGEKFDRLVALMSQLRAPGGCPWDREQTFDSIKPFTVEETYEVLDAIDARDWKGLREELGDFLLQAVFYGEMADEAGHFRIEDSLDSINEKLVRRHPHIFSDAVAETPAAVLKQWNEIKAEEKVAQGEKPRLLLDSISRSTPAMVEAQQISARAAKVGFDWENTEQVIAKLHEELGELAEAREGGTEEELEGEIGDLLFVLVNLARHVKVDAEQALRKSNRKFRRRFGYVEQSLNGNGMRLQDASLAEMERLWLEAKAGE